MNMENSTFRDDHLFTMNEIVTYTNNVNVKQSDPIWILIMDRSQLIMTVVGVIANAVTFITLNVNGQVSVKFQEV